MVDGLSTICLIKEPQVADSFTTAPKKEKHQALQSNYLGQIEISLWIAAYTLDRRFKLDYISKKGIELCLRAITRILMKSGYTIEQVKSTLYIEFVYYRNFKRGYRMTTSKPIGWWNEKEGCGLLARVGQRLAHLKASTANIEHTFSSIKSIQGDNRSCISRELIIHTARIKIYHKDGRDEWQ